ncbi:MAG: Ku protein, partial [Rhodospirillales bacterium]|nr:Ku protein [Acetobacter sp.]
MRYAAELRSAQDYFRDIKKVEVAADSLELAKMLIQRRAGAFQPNEFVDGYEVAVKELVEAKLQHAPVPQEVHTAPARGKVVNLMDALRKSVGGGAPDQAKAEPGAVRPPKKEPKRAAAGGLSLVKGAAEKAPAKSSAKRETKTAAKSASKRKSA